MATAAGEGETSYGGGAGGKFRKRPFRKPQTKPYDRPPAIIRNQRREGWLSKLVDPASKFISARAFKFFSNFRKRLTVAEQVPSERHQEAVLNNCAGECEPATDPALNSANSSGGNGISELEQILKQKTFTRSEIDHLMELLHSRTVEIPVGNEEKSNEANLSQIPANLAKHDGFTRSPVQENRNDMDKFHGIISSPLVSLRVLEEDVAAPAELAKAYMGSRPFKVSPSLLGLRSQSLKEETPLPSYISLSSKPSTLELTSKSMHRVGVAENGFTTPRSRGRSAIYSMARTPYSRVHPSATQKGSRSTNYGYGGPTLSSQSALEHERHVGSKQLVLKRRSSELDDDTGSIGAIRRIRQKANISYLGGPLSNSGTRVGYSAGQNHMSLPRKPLLSDEIKHKISKDIGENGNDSIPSTIYSLVPSQSTMMATKILRHLEKLTPKGKSPESKLVFESEKSSFKLTPNMLRGQALRSLEDVDSSNLLQKQDGDKLKDVRKVWLQDTRAFTSQNQDNVEEHCPKDSVVPFETLKSSANGDSTDSLLNTIPNIKDTDCAISKVSAQPLKKKQAFQMSAHEDTVELEDENHPNGVISSPLGEGREEAQTSNNVVMTEAIMPDKPPALPEKKLPVASASNKITDEETSGGSVVGKDKDGLDFLTSLVPSTTFHQDMHLQSTSEVHQFMPPKDLNAPAILFGLDPKKVDKVPSYTFSPASAANELPLNSGLPVLEKKNPNSLANDPQPTNSGLDKGDYKNIKKTESTKGTSEKLPSGPMSTSTSGLFSFSMAANISNLNNGLTASSPFVYSSASATLTSTSITNQNSSTNVPSSTGTSHMTSAGIKTAPTISFSDPSTSAAVPSFHVAPKFTFGNSMASSTPVATLSTASGAATPEMKSKAEKEASFGNVSPFGGTSFALTSSGSSTFAFNASITNFTGNNQSQGTLSGSGSVSAVTLLAPPATGVANVKQSMPFQFGSSGASPVFETSGIASFTASSSLFGSSDPAAKPFGSGTTFGLSSSTFSDTNSISSTGGATGASVFSSSWQTSKSPTFGLEAKSPSTGFSFGASSASIAATKSAPMMFGSTGTSSSSMFSFTSATAITSSLPSLSQSQPMFANSIVFPPAGNSSDQMSMEDSMAEDPVQASTPSVPVFGRPLVLPSPGFTFGSSAPSQSPFQFAVQQNSVTPQNLSPFQPSNSLDFSAGGSFSLGSSDKSARKVVRVSRNRNRKK